MSVVATGFPTPAAASANRAAGIATASSTSRADDESTGVGVEMIDVVKDYGATRALTGLNMTIRPGEFLVLLGPSGCGKTTALRVLSGLEGTTSGRILIAGNDVDHVPVHKRDIGMVFQSYSLFPHMTVRENVEFGLRMRKIDKAGRRSRAEEALDMVGLASFADRYGHQLSGGQQQRVALARALVTRPRVLLLDEPLSALDAKVRVQLREEIRRIQKELGITTLFVTHDQEEALAVADRVAVMNAGGLEQLGAPEELYLNPASPFVADFVGVSNKLPGMISSGTSGAVSTFGAVVSVYEQQLSVIGENPPHGAVTAYVRPEDISFAEEGLPGVVASSSFLGSQRRTFVRLEDGNLVTVQHEVNERHSDGDEVKLRFTGRPVQVAVRE